MKTLVFDMDGTIANFYGVEGWLEDLHNENPRPYIMAEPLWDMALLGSLLCCLKSVGYRIVVTSWLSKDSTKDFDEVVRTAKRDWLARYDFPFDEIHLVKYGTTKANCTRKHGGNQILFDDNAKVRKGWSLGETVDPTAENIIDFLADLLLTEQVSGGIINIESEINKIIERNQIMNHNIYFLFSILSLILIAPFGVINPLIALAAVGIAGVFFFIWYLKEMEEQEKNYKKELDK